MALLRSASLLPAVILALALPAAAASSDLVALSLEELMNLEVTLVSRGSQTVSEVAAAVTVITADDLRRSGVHSLPEALRLAPGLQVSIVDANKWNVTARGFSGLFANKLLVLIDGRSVYTPLFSGVFWESQDVLFEDVERIEIIRGPGGTLWGANAVNGIINIVTRTAAQTQGGLVQLGAGSGERGAVSGRFGARLASGAHYRVWGKYFDRGRSSSVQALPVRDDWLMGRGGFRVDYRTFGGDDITLQGDFHAGEVGQSLTFIAGVPEPPAPAAETFYFDARVRGGNVLGRWTRDPGSPTETSVQTYFDLFSRREIILDGNIRSFDVDLQQRLQHGQHQIVVGGGYRLTDDDFDGSFTMSLDPAGRTYHLFSGFVHDELQLLPDRLRLSAGSKFEHNSFSGFEWQPNARIWWAPAAGHAVWGAVARAVRTPSRGDHDFRAIVGTLPSLDDSTATLVRLLGDRRFDSEKLLAFDAGYRARLNASVNVDAAAFLNLYDDHFVREPASLPFAETDPPPIHLILPLRIENGATATSMGFETAVDWDVIDSWRLRAAYTYFDLDIELPSGSRDTGTKGYEGDSPQHQLALRSYARLPSGWELYASGRYVDALPASLVDAYVALDARLGWRPVPGLQLSLAAVNLLDRRHREGVANVVGAVHTAAERDFQALASWEF